ncbi:MAG: VWA domain-containing protein [Planctomycetes bacterium]|nr:VWA domain-containing protein [Planctomycetota bacterium]
MSFAAPAGIWLALVAVPVVVLYLLKIRRHRRTVPYLRLWERLVGERQFTTLFRRLQKWLSLLLQLLILASIVLAFAAWTLSDSFLKEESVVLVVDTSASMSGRTAPDDARTRFESAVQRARELVEGRSAEDRYAVVAAGAEPEVLQGFTRSTLRLREALDRLTPTRASGDLPGAVALCRDLLADAEHPVILLLSDVAGGSAPELAAADDVVRWLPVGRSTPNVAIRRFQVRRNIALGTDDLLLVVANESDEPRSVEVEIAVSGNLRTVLPLELAAREVKTEHRDLGAPVGGFLEARLVHPAGADGTPGADGLAQDDVAFAAIEPAKAFRVLLVTRDEAEQAPFLAALEALGPLIDRDETAGTTPELWPSLPPSTIAGYDLVVFVNEAPASLPATGRFLCLHALPGGLPARAAADEQAPQITELDRDHPMNRFLQERSLRPPGARPLDLTAGDVFLSTAGGPVGVVFDAPGRRVVYVGLDLLADLFFLQVAFPILLRNALAWMDEEATRMLEPTYRPGEPLRPRLRLPDDVREAEVGRATGLGAGDGTRERTIVPVRDGRFTFTDTQEPGRYWVRVGDRAYRTTVNLFDAAESDLTMPDAGGPVDPELERSGFLFGRDLWPILALVALGLWLCEWLLFHRRVTE